MFLVSPVAAVTGAAQTIELINESPKNIVVSPVAAVPVAAKTMELVESRKELV